MEFCPNCGSVLIPAKKNGKTVLKCRKCGYEKAVGEKGYKTIEKVSEEKKTRVDILEVPVSKKRAEEEKEFVQEYYEIFLESYGESEGGE